MKTFTHIQDMLDTIPLEDGEADRNAMNSIVEAMRQLDNPRDVVPLLFRWFEAHGEYDLGSPGPFVHFIEEQLDYFATLIESLATKPTDHIVWMANRIANGETDPARIGHWVNLIRAAAAHPLASESCKQAALDFVVHQASR